jgi:hypothetical protein
LVTLRCTPDKMPPILTICASDRSPDRDRVGSASSAISSASEQSLSLAMMCSMPNSGWSET